MIRARSVRVAAVLAFVVLAGACSKSSSSTTAGPASGDATSSSPAASAPSAAAYVKDACTAMTDWLTAIQTRAGDLSSISGGDVAAAKTAMLDFLDGVLTDTDTMVSTVEGLGAPDVTDGASAHEALVGVLKQARDLFGGFRDDVADLPTDDPQAFATALTQLGTNLDASSSDIGNAFSDFQNEELDSAFSAEPACAPLQSASPSP